MTHQSSGKFLPKDASGYIINDTAHKKIAAEFKPIIDDVKSIIIDILGESLHSIYLAGSIPRGIAIPGKSDLDVFAILEPHCTPDKSLSLIKDKCNSLITKHAAVSKIDVELWTFTDIFPLASNLETIVVKDTLSIFDAILKNSSLCIYGDDLSQHIPPIKPNAALANNELSVIHDDIEQARSAIMAAKKANEVEYWCKRVMKNIIRAGFCLCIPIIEEQTRDIDLCAKIFSKYYPDMKHISTQALTWIKNPSPNANEIIEFLDNEGAFFLTKVNSWMKRYNPGHKKELPREKK